MPILEADLEACARQLNIPVGDLTVVTVPIKKGMKKGSEACQAQVVQEMWNDKFHKLILHLGVSALLNAGGFSKVEKGDAEAALAVCAERIEQLYKGELRAPTGWASLMGKKKAISDRAIEAEANRIAKEKMKQLIRDAGKKVTHYKASDIAKAAAELREDDAFGPAILEEARKNVQARVKNKEEADKAAGLGDKKANDTISLLGLKEDPEAKAKAEAKTKEKKAKAVELGAITKAGKPGQATHARH